MGEMISMGLTRTDGMPEYGPSNWKYPTKADRIAGENEPDPETAPCPFCGSEYTQVRWIGFPDVVCGVTAGFRGECTDCWAMTRACSTKEEAAYWWNIRTNK